MSLPLKHLGTGALQELATLDIDYLAYQAGIHLGKMTNGDVSAITTNGNGATAVGSFTDTYFESSVGSTPGTSWTVNFTVEHRSNPGTGVHTAIFTAQNELPSPLYVGDTVYVIVNGDAVTGFEEIGHELAVSGDALFDNEGVSTTPTANSVDGTRVEWEDFSTVGGLSGSYQSSFEIKVTQVGLLNFTLTANSTDVQNTTKQTANTSIVFPTVEVEETLPPEATGVQTDLYQVTTASQPINTTSALKKNPLYWNRALTPNGVKEMNDAELDAFCEELVIRIMRDELPGTYRLSANSPGVDWVQFVPSVFNDTRGDGTVIPYSIWIRQAGIKPAVIRPVYAARNAQQGWAGLREHTDAEVEFTFGERVKKAVETTGIGKYQLRSAIQDLNTITILVIKHSKHTHHNTQKIILVSTKQLMLVTMNLRTQASSQAIT